MPRQPGASRHRQIVDADESD